MKIYKLQDSIWINKLPKTPKNKKIQIKPNNSNDLKLLFLFLIQDRNSTIT